MYIKKKDRIMPNSLPKMVKLPGLSRLWVEVKPGFTEQETINNYIDKLNRRPECLKQRVKPAKI